MTDRRRGAVIAISGLDGAGKTTQGEALVAALEAAGFPAVMQWHRISANRSLLWLTAPLRFALRLVMRLRSGKPVPTMDPDDPFFVAPEHQATRQLRERLPLLSTAWVTVVAVLHALSVRRDTVRETRRDRLVVRDRYLLDALVHLEDKYAGVHGVRLQARLIRALTPRPLAAFYLDVSADEAWRRKPEEFSRDELDRQRQGYLRMAGDLGVTVLDGERPAGELTDEIVRDVLAALRR